MSHSRNVSLDSAKGSDSSLSSLTSISSRASVEIYNADLKPVISDILQNEEDLANLNLADLVKKAEEMIKKFSADERNIFTYQKDDKKATVNLHEVMSAMLACAEECGGESGKRYVALAITLCGDKGDDNVVGLLVALGTTWLTHLLFICKFQRVGVSRHRQYLSQNEQEPRNAAQ